MLGRKMGWQKNWLLFSLPDIFMAAIFLPSSRPHLSARPIATHRKRRVDPTPALT
jgi:hypothetical protein